MASEQKNVINRDPTEGPKRGYSTASQMLTGLRNRLHAKFPSFNLDQKGVPKPIVDKPSRLASHGSTSTKPQAYFRFMDLPDELQLRIIACAIESSPRTCEIREQPVIADKDLLEKRRNPLKVQSRSPRIKMAEVNHKIRAMTLESYPQCLTITKNDGSVHLPVRINLDYDVLIVPEWIIKDLETEISNLTAVKFLVIAYQNKRPNAVTLYRLSMLPENARVGFVHEGIHHGSLRSKYITLKGPFWHEDYQVARNTRLALEDLARICGGRPVPTVCDVRLACRRHGRKEQTGWLYKKVKGCKYVFARWMFEVNAEVSDHMVNTLRAALEGDS